MSTWRRTPGGRVTLSIQAATAHRANKDAADQADARHLAALKAKEEAERLTDDKKFTKIPRERRAAR